MSVMPLRRKRGKCFPTGASKPERCACGHPERMHEYPDGRCHALWVRMAGETEIEERCGCPNYSPPKGGP